MAEYDPLAEQEAPLKAGHAAARKNAKHDAALDNTAAPDKGNSDIEKAQKLAKKNAKLDDSRRGIAEMDQQDVGTSERDIPEGAPVTTEREADNENPKPNEKKAASKNPEVKKDMPNSEKRQGTNKDSAPDPTKTDEHSLEENTGVDSASAKKTESTTTSKTADKK